MIHASFTCASKVACAVVAIAGVLLLGCAAKSKATKSDEHNGGSFSVDGADGTRGETHAVANRIQYVSTSTSIGDLCSGAWVSEVSTVTFQRAPEGTLAWGFRLSNQARALLGLVVTVTMPFAYVNGRPVSPPYGPHMEESTYNFHGSMNNYQLIGGGGGALQTGDQVTFFWHLRGSTDTGAYRFIVCQVPPPGSG